MTVGLRLVAFVMLCKTMSFTSGGTPNSWRDHRVCLSAGTHSAEDGADAAVLRTPSLAGLVKEDRRGCVCGDRCSVGDETRHRSRLRGDGHCVITVDRHEADVITDLSDPARGCARHGGGVVGGEANGGGSSRCAGGASSRSAGGYRSAVPIGQRPAIGRIAGYHDVRRVRQRIVGQRHVGVLHGHQNPGHDRQPV